MRTLFRSSALATMLVLLFVASTGCSTGPEETDGERLDIAAAEDLVQTQDVLLAVRLQPDTIGTLTPLFQRLAQAADDPDMRQLADISADPLGYLRAQPRIPNELSALAEDAPSYLLFSQRGNEDFLIPARLGLPTHVEDWPAYFNVRLLLASDNPAELSDQLSPWLGHFEREGAIGASEVYEGPGFVRVELAVPPQGPAHREGVDGDDWLDDLNLDNLQPPASADYRPTPAYNAFVEDDSPFGLWAPIDGVAKMGAFEILDHFAGEYDDVAAVGQPKFFLEGVSRIAAASIADDPISAEYEDLAVVLRADDSGALAADGYATRTQQGVRVREATRASIGLPVFQTDLASMLRLSFQANLDGLDDAVHRPYWSTVEQPDGAPDMAAEFQAGEAVDDSMLSFASDPVALPIVTLVTQYPWATFAVTKDNLGQMFPIPRAVAVEAFTLGEQHPLPAGGVAVAAFDESSNPRASLQQWLMLAERALGEHFDANMVDRDDNLVELHVAVGAQLDELFGGGSELSVRPTELSLDLAGLPMTPRGVPGAEALDMFDQLDVRSRSEQNYQAIRLSMGSPDSYEPNPVDAQVEPLQNPQQRCRTEIAASSWEHLSDLRTNARGSVDRWAEAVNQLTADCLQPTHPAAPLIDERIELAKELAAEIP